MPRSGIRGRRLRPDPVPGRLRPEGDKRSDNSGAMPAELVTGDDAHDVAAYVAAVVGAPRRGQRPARRPRSRRPAAARPPRPKNGVLSIAADPSGQLAYVTNRANAPAGELKVEMPNESATPHDIVIDDKGTGRGRPERRRLRVRGRLRGRRVHVLLLRAGPPRGRHGGHAHRQVAQVTARISSATARPPPPPRRRPTAARGTPRPRSAAGCIREARARGCRSSCRRRPT